MNVKEPASVEFNLISMQAYEVAIIGAGHKGLICAADLYYHLDMTFNQMVFFRPLPELAKLAIL